MDQVVVFQKMFEQVRKEQNFSWFYSELKHHRIAHYIYYLATDNIRIITHDDTVLLLRGTRNLLKVSTTKNPAKIKEAALLHICGKSGFAPIFPDTCYHLTHYWPAAVDIPVASDNPVHYADAIRYNARTPLQGSLLPLTRLV